jgi:DNA-binding NarL/FixJ family response regulator
MKSDTPQTRIRVMIVEDHVMVRMGLVSVISNESDMEVVAEVEDGRQVVECFRQHRPDVVVLDWRMPGADGIEVMKALRSTFGPVRILISSSFGGGDDVARAMQEGASGYVVKGTELQHLLDGIRTVHAGGQFLPTEIAGRKDEHVDSEYSTREADVLRLIAGREGNKDVGSGQNTWKTP